MIVYYQCHTINGISGPLQDIQKQKRERVSRTMSRTNRVSNGFLSFLLRVKGQDSLSSHRERKKGKTQERQRQREKKRG